MGFSRGRPEEKDRPRWGSPKLNSIENRGFGRGGQNRTADLLVPNQAPYRWATPRSLSREFVGNNVLATPGFQIPHCHPF